MSVLIGVGGEPTLGQQYNRAYFQTSGRYICVIQKNFGDVSFDF